jgi:hypothetical protein
MKQQKIEMKQQKFFLIQIAAADTNRIQNGHPSLLYDFLFFVHNSSTMRDSILTDSPPCPVAACTFMCEPAADTNRILADHPAFPCGLDHPSLLPCFRHVTSFAARDFFIHSKGTQPN